MSIDLSLDRIRDLISHLPPYTRPTCHIAGTNGKGSVAALLSSIFAAAGYTVGRFNSPHLVHVHDCISLNNATVSRVTYDSIYTEVCRTNEENACRASSFELLTVTALQIFERAEVHIVVLEVGMGGRLDATNVIPDECVLVSALTAVDLDHQAFLGETVAKIAREKAAIARPGKPFVLGPQTHTEVEEIVRAVIEEVGGSLLRANPASLRGHFNSQEVLSWDPSTSLPPQAVQVKVQSISQILDVDLPLHGRHQLDNLGTVAAVVDALLSHTDRLHVSMGLRQRLTAAAVASGIREVSWPGRLSFHAVPILGRDPLTVLADGAHNPASARTLSSYIVDVIVALSRSLAKSDQAGRTPFHLAYIIGLSHSPPKTPQQVLEPLLHLPIPLEAAAHVDLKISVAAIRFTPPDGMPWVKSVPPADIRQAISALDTTAVLWKDNDEAIGPEQIAKALSWVADERRFNAGRGLAVLAGSLYLVADLYRLIV
jgi:dihydrofolate synthase